MTIEERIQRLERTNRRHRLMFALFGVVAVCAVGISATQDGRVPDVIRAKAFEVVDDEGVRFAKLGQAGGAGAFATFDKTGNMLVSMMGLTVDGKHAGFVSTLREGKRLVSLRATPSGSGVIQTFHNQGKVLVELGSDWDGQNGSVVTYNFEGRKLVAIRSMAEGEGGRLAVYNKTDEVVCSLRANENGHGRMAVWDQQGNVVLILGTVGTENGVGGHLSVIGAGGKPVAWLGAAADRPGGELIFVGQEVKDSYVYIGTTSDGGAIIVRNKTGQGVCDLSVDEYGNGVIGVWDRNGKGRTLKPGP